MYDLLQKFPPLDDKARIEIINSFQVVEDHLRVRQRPTGFLARFWQSATGEDRSRTNDILLDTTATLKLLHAQVSHLEAEKVRTWAGIELMARACVRLEHDLQAIKGHAVEVQKLASRVHHLEQFVTRLDRKVDGILVLHAAAGNLRAGHYRELPPLLQVMFAVEMVVWEAGDTVHQEEGKLFDRAVHELADAAGEVFGLKRHDIVALDALVWKACPISSEARDAVLLLNDYGREPGTIGTLFLDASAHGAVATADSVGTLIAEAGGRFVMPLESLVRRLLVEAHQRVVPTVVILSVPPVQLCDIIRQSESAEIVEVRDSEMLQPNTRPSAKIGLVLSGGGAKGAYLAGVLKAMAEHKVQPSAVAGTSIGALNGAIVAGCRDVSLAAKTLEDVWRQLAKANPIGLDSAGFSALLGETILKILTTVASPRTAPLSGRLLGAAKRYAEKRGIAFGMLNVDPIIEILHGSVDVTRVGEWLPFWVGAFRGSLSEALWEGFKGYVLGMENKEADFFRVQDFSPEQVQSVVLASAALPVLYPSQALGDSVFFDGGIGGARRQQGNTPITPLVEFGCERCVVTHLSNGSLWTRHEFPTLEVLEVRPIGDLAGEGWKAMLNFSEEKIEHLMEMGYKDADRVFTEVEDQIALGEASRSQGRRHHGAPSFEF